MMERREAFWQDRFYRFEHAARALFEPPEPRDLPAGDLRELAGRAFSRYPDFWFPVVFCFAPGRDVGLCHWDGERITIWLPPGRQRPWCLLHEVAHAVGVAENDGHDPRFIERCVGLWLALGDWPREPLRQVAALYGCGTGRNGGRDVAARWHVAD